MERKAIAKKKKEVDSLTEKLEKAISFYIVDYTGLDANAMNNLRGKFRSGNFDYFVIKNSILERASERLGFDEILEVLAGPNSISISYDDPIGPVRIINDYYKETELPVVKLCFIEGKWLTAKEVKRLADLPPREVLAGQVLNVIVSPLSGFINLLQNHLSGLVRIVDGVREKKLQEEEAAVEEVVNLVDKQDKQQGEEKATVEKEDDTKEDKVGENSSLEEQQEESPPAEESGEDGGEKEGEEGKEDKEKK